MERKRGPYERYVEAMTSRNPCLLNLHTFLSTSDSHRKPSRISFLNFRTGDVAPELRRLDLCGLSRELNGEEHGTTYGLNGAGHNGIAGCEEDAVLGRILIVEDISKDVIEALGSSLDIDPLFFAAHVHASHMQNEYNTPTMATLPSRTKSHEYTNIGYHRTVRFPDMQVPLHRTVHLVRDANIRRKLVILPSGKSPPIGLAQHCCSILRTTRKDGTWLGIVLVDPPIGHTFLGNSERGRNTRPVNEPSQLYMGGYEDFLDLPSIHAKEPPSAGPQRLALLDDLGYYWSRELPPCFSVENPSLLGLAYYPLRIVAGEWSNYTALLQRSIKQYEYSANNLTGFLPTLDILNSDMRALQSWKRRCMVSQLKIRGVIRMLSAHQGSQPDQGCSAALLEDFQYLFDTIEDRGRRLASVLPVVTSIVQIVDSRRAYAETANIRRLTILALIFVPLTFVSGVFSMNAEYSPGNTHFWVYFAVAVPVTLAVFLIARPPVRELRVLRERTLSRKPSSFNSGV